MKIETKYSIGDVVYHGRNTVAAGSVECPDCKGTKEWAVTTPAGDTMAAPCSTCDGVYGPTGAVPRSVRVPVVDRLTIGSVRFDSNENGMDAVSYMCIETGIGSGQIWYQGRLRATREEAEVDAVSSVEISERTIAEANKAHREDQLRKAARRAKRAEKRATA